MGSDNITRGSGSRRPQWFGPILFILGIAGMFIGFLWDMLNGRELVMQNIGVLQAVMIAGAIVVAVCGTYITASSAGRTRTDKEAKARSLRGKNGSDRRRKWEEEE
jgi:nitrate reductase gamma subunit